MANTKWPVTSVLLSLPLGTAISSAKSCSPHTSNYLFPTRYWTGVETHDVWEGSHAYLLVARAVHQHSLLVGIGCRATEYLPNMLALHPQFAAAPLMANPH
jgi:hypothetical protein